MIKERLDHLCGLLSVRLVGQETRIFQDPPGYLPELPPLREYPLEESIISRHWRKEFPFMTIQTPSMMCLLELNPKLAAQLVAWERTDLSTLSPPDEGRDYVFQYQDALRSVRPVAIKCGFLLKSVGHSGLSTTGYTTGTRFSLQNSSIFTWKSLPVHFSHQRTLVSCSSWLLSALSLNARHL